MLDHVSGISVKRDLDGDGWTLGSPKPGHLKAAGPKPPKPFQIVDYDCEGTLFSNGTYAQRNRPLRYLTVQFMRRSPVSVGDEDHQ